MARQVQQQRRGHRNGARPTVKNRSNGHGTVKVNPRESSQAAQAICRIPAYCPTKEDETSARFEETYVDLAQPAIVLTRSHKPTLSTVRNDTDPRYNTKLLHVLKQVEHYFTTQGIVGGDNWKNLGVYLSPVGAQFWREYVNGLNEAERDAMGT